MITLFITSHVVGCSGYTQLKLLDVNNIGQLLHKCIPSSWLSASSRTVEWNPAEFGHPPAGWLESVWLFLVNHAARDLGVVTGLPLIPCRSVERTVPGGREETVVVLELVPLSTEQTCLARYRAAQINYLRQGGYVFASFCLFVCLFVCVLAR